MGNSKGCVTYQKTLENCEAAADDDGSFSVDCRWPKVAMVNRLTSA